VDALWQDVLFGIRMLRKSPGFTAVAVLALALGIGANATVFTIANVYLFQSLPFVDSERIVYISSVNNSTGRGRGESYPDYRDFQSQVRSFAALGAFSRSDVDVNDKNGLPTQYKGFLLLGHNGSHLDISSVWRRHQEKVAILVRGLANACPDASRLRADATITAHS